MLGGVTFPGFETVEPLEAQKAKFLKSTLPFGRGLLAAVYVPPPCGWVTACFKVSEEVGKANLYTGDSIHVPITSL